MPGPVIPNPTPDWLKPENASVTDTALMKAMRMIGHLIGADNPTAQVLGLMMTDVPGGSATGGLAKAVEGLKARVIKAYHGSPHDFERFSLEKIGTGEGAQAYGHGLYFAENPTVAREYQKSLGGDPVDALLVKSANRDAKYSIGAADATYGTPEWLAANELALHKGDIDQAIKLADKHAVPVLRQWKDEGAQFQIKRGVNPGRTYEVAIHADPEDFLDWDKPLSQQNIKPELLEHLKKSIRKEFTTLKDPEKATGADLYSALRDKAVKWKIGANVPNEVEQQGASAILKDAGIPGIKYLDQGSRDIKNVIVGVTRKSDGVLVGEKAFATQPEATAYAQEMTSKGMLTNIRDQASRNYVVFDDRLIDILKKYGLLLPAAGAATQGQTLISPRGEQ